MSQVCLPWIIAQSFANDSPAARTALRTQFSQLQRTFPVSMPLRSRQMVAPQSSLKGGKGSGSIDTVFIDTVDQVRSYS